MIIQSEKQIVKRIRELMMVNDENIAISNLLYSLYVDVLPNAYEQIKENINQGTDEADALLTFINEYLEISDDEEAKEFIKKRIFKDVNKIDADDFINNPYYISIKKEGKFKDCSLKTLSYKPYQLFPLDDLYIKDYYEHQPIGYFNKEFHYLALLKNKDIWMSLNPNEITTMKPYINKAHGNVLVLGLGMGYVAYMMAMKKEVKKITIIEKDINVINIFNNLIWPSFINKEKIQIISDDAIKYTKNNQKKYDYIFADLWHSPEDGLSLFIDLKKINRNIDCWLETSMYALLRRCMITLLFETTQNYKESNYLKAKNDTDKVINQYYFRTKKVSINEARDLDILLDSNNLLDLLIND